MTSSVTSAMLTPELGKYHLIAELARGGMGNVYLAVAQGPGGFCKLLVVKELRPEFAEDETFVAMFVEEARLAARLTHPNIVQTNEVGSEGCRHYMIMEYLDGRSLHRVAKHLGRQGALPVGVHLRVIAEALRGLHYAHELRGFDGEPLGIVHRDVSPLNLFLTFDGQAKVLDFGIAKAFDSSLETQAGILKGRIAYMSPEQARGGKVDRRADVYSAGVMIWEATAEHRLWRGMNDLEILTKTLGEGPPRLRSVHAAVPPELDALCARAMAVRPEDRHPTAAALLEDLEEHLLHRDDEMPMRDIGSMVSRAFEPERQRMNATIEDVLGRMRGAPQSGVMPTLRTLPLGAETRSPVAPLRSLPDDFVSMSALLASTPSTQLAAGRTIRSVSAVRSSRATVPDIEDRPHARGKRAAVAAGVLAAACLALTTVHRHTQDQKAEAQAAIAAPVPAPAVDRVVPTVPSAPPVAVDSRATASNPVTAPRTTAPPRWAPPLAQRAPRYGSSDPARTPAPEGTAGAPLAARPEVDPGGGRAPMRPIVTSNPYEIR